MPSPEFQLAAQACRRAFDGSFEIERLDKIGWNRLLTLARRHRIQGLVFEGLRRTGIDMPEGTRSALSADAEEIIRTNLAISYECATLSSSFETAGIPLIFLKGLALAAQVYPNPFLKMGWDIDVLVNPENVGDAAQILSALGYTTPISRSRLGDWHRRRKESPWAKPGGFHLELHTRLADNPALLMGIDAATRAIPAALPGGIVLPTLSGDELFAYLCVHGTGSAWMRLKWLSDLAALLHEKDAASIETLYDRSLALGAGRTATTALVLANEHFGTSIPEKLKFHWTADAPTRRLTALCANYLSGRYELDEPTAVAGGTMGIHAVQLLLAPGPKFAAGEALRQIEERLTRAFDGRDRAGSGEQA